MTIKIERHLIKYVPVPKETGMGMQKFYSALSNITNRPSALRAAIITAVTFIGITDTANGYPYKKNTQQKNKPFLISCFVEF